MRVGRSHTSSNTAESPRIASSPGRSLHDITVTKNLYLEREIATTACCRLLRDGAWSQYADAVNHTSCRFSQYTIYRLRLPLRSPMFFVHLPSTIDHTSVSIAFVAGIQILLNVLVLLHILSSGAWHIGLAAARLYE